MDFINTAVPPTSELEAPVCEDDEDQETKDDELLPTPDDEQHADSFTEIEILGLVDGDANTAAQSSVRSLSFSVWSCSMHE